MGGPYGSEDPNIGIFTLVVKFFQDLSFLTYYDGQSQNHFTNHFGVEPKVA